MPDLWPCCEHCEFIGDEPHAHAERCAEGCNDEPEPGGATSAWEHHRD